MAKSMLRVGAIGMSLFVASFARADFDCKAKGNPVRGTVTQGGYSFDYESQVGEKCRAYRLRNNPGTQLTPIRWTDGETVFIDANLPGCKRGETCNWVSAVHYSTEQNKSGTQLGFGINKDEYKAKAVAFVEAKLAADANKPSSTQFVTVAGTWADAAGAPVDVNVSISNLRKLPFGKYTMDVSINQASLRANPKPLQIKWASARQTYFLRELTAVTGASEQYTVALEPQSCTPSDQALLTVTQGDATIASTSVPFCGTKGK